MKIVEDLFETIPPNYYVAPQVQLANRIEFDVAAYDRETPSASRPTGRWTMLAPPKPTTQLECEFPLQDEYEVRIDDANRSRELVATLEIVKPREQGSDRRTVRSTYELTCKALGNHR